MSLSCDMGKDNTLSWAMVLASHVVRLIRCFFINQINDISQINLFFSTLVLFRWGQIKYIGKGVVYLSLCHVARFTIAF